ncbi:MAG: hypothetical protein PUD60_01165 [Akkermansia muciniphila]|nr:hypothetical protein [Akkermansia muciniphila]
MKTNTDTDTMPEQPTPETSPDATPGAAPKAPPAEAAPLPPLMDADGAFSQDWFARFEELQPFAASLAKFRRPEALAKSYAHLERMRGYPDPEDARRMADFRAAVGLPEHEEEFSLPRPEEAPEELWDDALAADIARVAYRYGVPPRAMSALAQEYTRQGLRALRSAEQARHAAVLQAEAELQREWGAAYEDNMAQIASVLASLSDRAGVDAAALAENPALRASPDFAKLMLAVADQLQEPPLRSGSPSDSGPREAYRIAHDPTHPLHEAYMRTNHPRHRYANEQYDLLAFGPEH